MSITRERWMALFFALGSACFLIGPFPGYAQLVGANAVAITFFVGSILFTVGGGLQRPARPRRPRHRPRGRAAFRAAAVQSAGTLFFNVTTYQALHTPLSDSDYNRLVLAAGCVRLGLLPRLRRDRLPRLPRNGWRPRADQPGWWEPSVNLLGCVLFGISAVAGYLVPSTRLDARPGRGELDDCARRGVLPGLRARHAADRAHLQVPPPPAHSGARARRSSATSERRSRREQAADARPAPGADSMDSAPPAAETRSAMLSRPAPRSTRPSGRSPAPSSSTVKRDPAVFLAEPDGCRRGRPGVLGSVLQRLEAREVDRCSMSSR